jgi:hypothetical protein
MSYGEFQGVAGVEISSLILIYTRVETRSFVHSHFHLEMCILLGRDDPVMSYGGSKRGGGV